MVLSLLESKYEIMRLIKPTNFTPALLISTNATEIYSDWVNGNTYHDNDRVLYIGYQGDVQTKRIWECVANNTTTPPSATNAAWVDIGPSNKHAMFDTQVSTQTIVTGNMELVVKVASITTLAFLNVAASSVKVVIRDGLMGTILYDETKSLSGDTPLDWYEYFYYDPEEQRTTALFEYPVTLPSTSYAYVTVYNTGSAAVGYCAFGKTNFVGLTQYGMTSGIIDYSKKETDEFGVTTFVRRPFSKRLSANLYIDNLQVSRVSRLLQNVRAIPCLFIASDDPVLEEAAIVFGFYRDFNIEISYPSLSMCSLELEGLI